MSTFLPALARAKKLTDPFSPSGDPNSAVNADWSPGAASPYSLPVSVASSQPVPTPPAAPDPIQDIYMPRYQQAAANLQSAYAPPTGIGNTVRQVLGAVLSRGNPQLAGIVSGNTQRQQRIQSAENEYQTAAGGLTAERQAELMQAQLESEQAKRGQEEAETGLAQAQTGAIGPKTVESGGVAYQINPADNKYDIPVGGASGVLPVDQLNKGLSDRYQVLNPGKTVPPEFQLPPTATPNDFNRVDKVMQQMEQAQGTKTQQDTVNQMRQSQNAIMNEMHNQTLAIQQQGAAERQQKQQMTWAQWQNPTTGKTEAGPLSMAPPGTQPAQIDTRDIQGINDARQAVNLINKKGDKPEQMGVMQLIDSLDKDGKLGVASSRLNSFLAGGVGAEPGDDPRIMSLLDKSNLAMTLIMKAHFGASGGRSPQMLEHFLDMANAKKMNANTLRAGFNAVGDYMNDRAMIPAGTQQPAASTGGIKITRDANGRITGVE